MPVTISHFRAAVTRAGLKLSETWRTKSSPLAKYDDLFCFDVLPVDGVQPIAPQVLVHARTGKTGDAIDYRLWIGGHGGHPTRDASRLLQSSAPAAFPRLGVPEPLDVILVARYGESDLYLVGYDGAEGDYAVYRQHRDTGVVDIVGAYDYRRDGLNVMFAMLAAVGDDADAPRQEAAFLG